MATTGVQDRASRLWKQKLLVLGLGSALALALLEVVARLTYRPPWYERIAPHVPVGLLGSVPDRSNRYGLRDVDFQEGGAPDRRRVLILGDSFTYGAGVADEQAIFPRILERSLNAGPRPAGVTRVEVLNGGKVQTRTTEWLELWRTLRQPYRPDVVLAVFFLRAGSKYATGRNYFGRIRGRIVRKNWSSPLYRYCYGYRFIQDRRDQQTLYEVYSRGYLESYLEPGQNAEWLLAQRNLLTLRDEATASGATVGLVIFPLLTELRGPYPFQPILDTIDSFARAHAIPVHSLLPAFQGRDPPDLWVSGFDTHPGPLGHALAAESMLPFVRRLLEEHERRGS